MYFTDTWVNISLHILRIRISNRKETGKIQSEYFDNKKYKRQASIILFADKH